MWLALAGRSKLYQGEYTSAVELFERALEDTAEGILEIGFEANTLAYLAYAYQRTGRQEEARTAMEKSLDVVHRRQDWIWSHLIMPDVIAGIYAMQGREESAIETLRTAVGDGWLSYSVLLYEPQLESLRQRQDYRELMEETATKLEGMRQETGPLPPLPWG